MVKTNPSNKPSGSKCLRVNKSYCGVQKPKNNLSLMMSKLTCQPITYKRPKPRKRRNPNNVVNNRNSVLKEIQAQMLLSALSKRTRNSRRCPPVRCPPVRCPPVRRPLVKNNVSANELNKLIRGLAL